jgi:hypothetical protein
MVPAWYEGIKAAANGHDIHVAALYTDSDDQTENRLKEHGVDILYDEEEGRPTYQIDSHQWLRESYDYMSRLRNRLIEYALEIDAEYFFSVDSDVVLPPGALSALLEWAGGTWTGAIAPSLILTPENTHWGFTAWNAMQWHQRIPNFPVRDYEPATGKVDLIMAAMLLDRTAMECRWSRHDCGEDVGFCMDARDRGVPLWWVREVFCRHIMHRA